MRLHALSFTWENGGIISILHEGMESPWRWCPKLWCPTSFMKGSILMLYNEIQHRNTQLYICIYRDIYMYIYYIYIHKYMYIYIDTCIYTYKYIMHTHVYLCLEIRTNMLVYNHIYLYALIQLYISTYICMCYICIYFVSYHITSYHIQWTYT